MEPTQARRGVMPLIYVAGPFRGPTPLDVRRNVEAARDLGLHVARCGAYPVIPHTMTSEFDKQLTDQFWLDGTMELLRRCDGIVLHARWRSSMGAIAEHNMAADLQLAVFHADTDGWDDFFRLWVTSWKQNRADAV